jgi:ArsR family metal-binding transcriptional regulator
MQECVMQVDRICKVIPCISDPWKLRVILYLDERPDLQMFARHLEGRYAERLGVVMVRIGRRELSFFSDGKVTVREVDDVDEAEDLVNHLINMVYHKQFIFEEQ